MKTDDHDIWLKWTVNVELSNKTVIFGFGDDNDVRDKLLLQNWESLLEITGKFNVERQLTPLK